MILTDMPPWKDLIVRAPEGFTSEDAVSTPANSPTWEKVFGRLVRQLRGSAYLSLELLCSDGKVVHCHLTNDPQKGLRVKRMRWGQSERFPFTKGEMQSWDNHDRVWNLHPGYRSDGNGRGNTRTEYPLFVAKTADGHEALVEIRYPNLIDTEVNIHWM